MPTVNRRRAERPSLRAVPTRQRDSAEVLLRKVGRGDHDAFALLYDLLGAQVFGLVRRVLRDPAQAEEVTQEVFLEVWRQAPRFDHRRGSPQAWVLTIAHRRAVDRVRSEQARRLRDDRAGRDAFQRPVDTVAEASEVRLDHERVRLALAGLTDLQRQALELAYYGGHTYREVAELLDIPLGTAKTRLRDGLIRLRDEMGVGQ